MDFNLKIIIVFPMMWCSTKRFKFKYTDFKSISIFQKKNGARFILENPKSRMQKTTTTTALSVFF